jgi:murein DD-endopeptidase MepM/ murein hydrolase activator NlpD
MLRTILFQRLAGLAAAVALSSMFLTGCVEDSPRTQLDWYPQGDAKAHRHYAYNDDAPAPPPPHVVHKKKLAPVQMAALDCPVPKPKPDSSRPGWYTQNTLPAPSAPVGQPATYAPPSGSLIFASPVNGPVVADYGTTVSGERNVGINIAAPFGTPIHAAAAGEVSYAGNELRGYGNLVLLKHDDGYVTAYAHAERIVVNRGDYVQKGQIIGYVGQTGDVTSPQVHFEIRKGVTPINPHSMLASSRAS